MRTFRTWLAAALIGAASNALIAGFAQAQDCACPIADDGAGVSRARIVADEAPPPLPEYEQPPLPAPGYMWTPGYWGWNNDDYYWVPGTWVEPPHPGLLWTPGYWGFVDGAYAFHRGHWGEHIGFYGGVAYGYGYYGSGYEGGRWDGDRFYYNRTVNNFGRVDVVNVYEHPAPRIVERASFNGGPQGVKAAATPQELAAAKESHVAQTPAQRRNVSAASRNENAFVSTNNGKPPVAATAKPGVFKGPGVAPAKAAGGPVKPRTTEEPTNAETRKPELRKGAPEPRTEPAPKGEKLAPKADEAAPKTEKVEPETQRPEPKAEKKREPKAERAEPKAERPEPKVERAPKAERPEPKAERPEPKAERPAPKAERPEPKAERPAPRIERPEPKAERPEPKAERPPPRAEAPRPAPPRPQPEARPACHPGAPNCPK